MKTLSNLDRWFIDVQIRKSIRAGEKRFYAFMAKADKDPDHPDHDADYHRLRQEAMR